MTLKLENISFAYSKGLEVLTDISIKYGPGMHLLLGPNGAGKSTLLRLIAGLLRPCKGECILGRENTAFHSPHTAKQVFMLADDALYPLNTINDMVRCHAPFYPSFSKEFLAEALGMFGMTGDERLSDMSLGNRHKAQVAYALALGTRVLLLDEPANGLDIPAKKALTTMLARAMDADEERCIIVATHTVQEMRNLFDSVTILRHGKIALNATTTLISERLAFVADRLRRPDAMCYQPGVDGPTQIIPSDGSVETPIDYTLLFLAATGPDCETLNSLLS